MLDEEKMDVLEKLGAEVRLDEQKNPDDIFLYNDKTNPTNQRKNDPELWKSYFEKIEILSQLKILNY